jgi:predicted AAA+ superfamily ATPase
MEFAIEERLGVPELFTNRQEELAYFASWVGRIEKKAAISTAILSHRKVGKTALLQRLFNQLFGEKEGKVIPFLFEIKEQPLHVDEFSRLYYLNFISQLLSFKKRQWLGTAVTLEELMDMSDELKLDHVTQDIRRWQRWAEIGGGVLWTQTNEAPHRLAEISGERFLVMIDEFQYINKYIYRSTPFTPENQLTTLAGSYLGTSESKIAPMLITGSAVGMLLQLIYRLLPRRFVYYHLQTFKAQDFLELGYKLSNLYEVPVTDECLFLAHRLLGGHPAHLRELVNSRYEKKDLTTLQGLYDTYLFEVGHPTGGRIRAGWEEYIDLAFHEINERNAKKIVLFLAKHNEREWSRKEIQEHCGLQEMSDQELEHKLQALIAADLISKGRTDYVYQGLGDPAFEKVFRIKYEQEIEQIDFEAIRHDLIRELEEENRQLKVELASQKTEVNQLRGTLNQKKGEIGELWIKSVLGRYSRLQRYFAPGELGNNAEKIRFPRFRKIEAHTIEDPKINFDVFCQPHEKQELHLAVEAKNREAKKVSAEEVKMFADNLQALQEHLGEAPLQGLFYSFNGFQPEAIEKLGELKIFWWDFETLERLS